jgi:hypothetical protein
MKNIASLEPPISIKRGRDNCDTGILFAKSLEKVNVKDGFPDSGSSGDGDVVQHSIQALHNGIII